MVIQIRTQRITIPERGRISSAELNEFFANIVYDLAQAAEKINARESSETALAKSIRDELISVRGEIEALKSAEGHRRLVASEESAYQDHLLSMYDLSNLLYLDASAAAVRASVAPLYGQATVPMNGVQQKFFHLNFRTNEIVAPENLVVTVTGTFDKGDGEGSLDYEHGGTVTEGDTTLAFNGSNTDKWIREVSFELESDIDDVECEMTVRVPAQTNPESNTLVLHPHPWGEMDITDVAIAPDLGSTFTQIPGFAEVKGARYLRFFFAAQTVAQVRVRFRQPNWRPLNGRKVFRYGLEELGLQLVDWDKTWDAGESESNNHTMIHSVAASSGHKFTSLDGFWSTPDHTLEDAGLRHMHFKVATDANGDNIIWNSDSDSLPQSVQVTISGEISTLYVFTTLNWVASSGGSSSPFEVGTTPFLNEIGLRYKTEEI
jgi:hypothetical protein